MQVPPNKSLVGGLDLKVVQHNKNPAIKEEHRSRLYDGWLEIWITCNGTDVFLPKQGYWRTCVLKAKQGPPLKLSSSDTAAFVVLEAGDTVREITITEETINTTDRGDVFGIWQNVMISRPGEGLLRKVLYCQIPGSSLAPNALKGN